MRKQITIIICLTIIGLTSVGQVSQKLCAILDTVFNCKEVNTVLRINFKNDSLTLVDVQAKLKDKCDIIMWGTNQVFIIQDSALNREIKSRDPFIIFRNDCKAFILNSIKKRGRIVKISIHQPCSGLLAEIVVSWKKKVSVVSVTRLVL